MKEQDVDKILNIKQNLLKVTTGERHRILFFHKSGIIGNNEMKIIGINEGIKE